MRKIFSLITLTICMMACDIIPEGDRIKPAQPVDSQKRILLTEFTGMKCVNCPRAAELAHSLLETYPENIVVVAMHPASNSFTQPFEDIYDLRCPEADEYYKYFGGAPTTSFPKGVFNWKKYNNLYLQNDGNWEALMTAELNVMPDVLAGLEVAVNPQKAESMADVKVTVTAQTEVNNAALVLMITEDAVLAPQAFPEGEQHDYEHNHVLRTVLNGTWGENIAPIEAGDTWEKELTCGFDEDWDMQNCNIVAVLIDIDTHEVINCVETPVVGSQPTCVEFTLYDLAGNVLNEGDTLRVAKPYEAGKITSLQIDGRVECAEPIYATVTLKEPAEFTKQSFCTGMSCVPPAESYRLNNGSWYGHYDAEAPGQYIIDYNFHDEKGDHSTKITFVYECLAQ